MNIRSVRSVFGLGMLLWGMVHAASANMLLTTSEWQKLQAQPQRYASLLQRCASERTQSAQPVAVLSPAPHYSAYGINTQGNRSDHQLKHDAWLAYRAGLCYRLSGDKQDAVHAQRILMAWATTLQKIGTSQGRASINFNFPAMVIAGAWVDGVQGWNSKVWRRFLRTVIIPESFALEKSNNHASWGVLLDSTLGAYLRDDQLLAQTRHRWQTLLRSQADNDGTLHDEVCRSDTNHWCDGPTKGIKGLAYTHYALLPTTVAAQILAQQGDDVWHTLSGQLLGKAYARAAGWVRHPEQFPYYARNNGKLVGVRNAAYFVVLQRHYPNPDGAAVIADGGLQMDNFYLQLLFSHSE